MGRIQSVFANRYPLFCSFCAAMAPRAQNLAGGWMLGCRLHEHAIPEGPSFARFVPFEAVSMYEDLESSDEKLLLAIRSTQQIRRFPVDRKARCNCAANDGAQRAIV
jgi:hypothetical protein